MESSRKESSGRTAHARLFTSGEVLLRGSERHYASQIGEWKQTLPITPPSCGDGCGLGRRRL